MSRPRRPHRSRAQHRPRESRYDQQGRGTQPARGDDRGDEQRRQREAGVAAQGEPAFIDVFRRSFGYTPGTHNRR
ncbi:hypothetical protein [Streptomyces sp. TRM68367]|uniref:hypothetical protein n=1 Tax=Streptomyces sp. TRM68367 TaxID=2758415 RepID=UPI0037DCEA81